MNSIHQILETVVADSLVSDFNSVEVNEKLQRIQDHLRGRNIPPVTTVSAEFVQRERKPYHAFKFNHKFQFFLSES